MAGPARRQSRAGNGTSEAGYSACKAIAPILDEIAVEVAGKMKIAKMDVDQNQQIAGQFGIRSIPTLLVFKGGIVQEQMVGAMSKAALKAKLTAYM